VVIHCPLTGVAVRHTLSASWQAARKVVLDGLKLIGYESRFDASEKPTSGDAASLFKRVKSELKAVAASNAQIQYKNAQKSMTHD
jgi:hypothetical protein